LSPWMRDSFEYAWKLLGDLLRRGFKTQYATVLVDGIIKKWVGVYRETGLFGPTPWVFLDVSFLNGRKSLPAHPL